MSKSGVAGGSIPHFPLTTILPCNLDLESLQCKDVVLQQNTSPFLGCSADDAETRNVFNENQLRCLNAVCSTRCRPAFRVIGTRDASATHSYVSLSRLTERTSKHSKKERQTVRTMSEQPTHQFRTDGKKLARHCALWYELPCSFQIMFRPLGQPGKANVRIIGIGSC